jgi:hypothetical protein
MRPQSPAPKLTLCPKREPHADPPSVPALCSCLDPPPVLDTVSIGARVAVSVGRRVPGHVHERITVLSGAVAEALGRGELERWVGGRAQLCGRVGGVGRCGEGRVCHRDSAWSEGGGGAGGAGRCGEGRA